MNLEKRVDRSIDNFWEHYEAGHFDRGLAVVDQLGYDNDAARHAFDPNSYYVPNRRNDRLVKPLGVSSDMIPVIGMDSDQATLFETRQLHSLQEAKLSAAGVGVEALRRSLVNRDHSVRGSGRKAEKASVLTRGIDIDGQSFVADKPILLLNFLDESTTSEATDPDVILHELVHVTQFLGQPIQRYDASLQRELEAYAVQATLVEEPRVDYTGTIITAGEIDRFRHLHLGADQYVPTEYFTEVFRADQRFGHMGLPPKVRSAS